MENPETYAEKLIRLTPTMDGAWMATIFLIWNFDLSELFYNCCDLESRQLLPLHEEKNLERPTD
ncbi:unnamed protein product [Penicillium manginii]